MRYDRKITLVRRLQLFVLLLGVITQHCGGQGGSVFDSQVGAEDAMPEDIARLRRALENGEARGEFRPGVTIAYPYDETLFPPEIAAPTFLWKDASRTITQWLVEIAFEKRDHILAVSRVPQWTPSREIWEAIKIGSIAFPATVTISGFNGAEPPRFVGKDSIRISTSTDRLDATVMYRQVQLPFAVDPANFKKLKWRLGDIASYDPPPVVMEKVPVCASCHLATRDGSVLSMEMNYQEDSGAHLMVPVEKKIRVSAKDFMTWNDFPRPDVLPPTRGLFAKVSPSGKFMVGTVNEVSYSAVTGEKAFSQLFFPTYGRLAWFSTETRKMQFLPGADDIDYVQTDPSWRWDEREIAFARSAAENRYHDDLSQMKIHVETVGIEALNKRYPIQFDLFRMPFNNGKGGAATPIEGASFNGMSNYFARYSPDGKWIVFTRSASGIMLQPDSALFILPAEGGEPRRMRCNRSVFNSWHSFSPNGRWLVFSSKTNSPYTELFLTHIDAAGNDTPPVCLSRFSDQNYAANVPELVNIPPGGLQRILIKGQP